MSGYAPAMRGIPSVIVAATMLIVLAPIAAAEPGVWPDCDPNNAMAMSECTIPPAGGCTPPAIDAFSGLNGGAFVCAASGQWAWRSMTYPQWETLRTAVQP